MVTRFRAAWNCLRGRPTAYRVKIEQGSMIGESGGFYAENIIIGSETAFRVGGGNG